MAAGNRYSRKVLSIREQLARVRAMYPHFRSGVRQGMLQMEGNIRPTERSVDYHVRFEYEAQESPQVWVLDPKLVPREPGGEIKHVYPSDRLCLFLPHSGEWSPDKSLAHTIVPWTAEWLFHYEIWLVTGEWCGGGVEPRQRRTIRNSPEGDHGARDDDRATP